MTSPTPIKTATRIVRRESAAARQIDADICVVGAGSAGISAALEAARLGRKVVLVDGLHALGGQAVNAVIGTFCGFFSNGYSGYQTVHGIADGILRDLGAQGALHYRHGGPSNTIVVQYDEVALARWIEEAVRQSGITVLLGAVMRAVNRDGRRIRAIELATRYGDVSVAATGFVDATGDAALAWNAGLACRESAEGPIYGTQMCVIEGIDETKAPERPDVAARLKAKAKDYGLTRESGFAFVFPGKSVALVNMTHVETPLDPLEATQKSLEGKVQADRAVAFLRGEYPAAFGNARVRTYGMLGMRQTRWIVGRQQLTVEDVRAGPQISRCGRAHRLADRAARHAAGPCVGGVSRRPPAHRAVRQPRVARVRQHGRGRAQYRRRRRGALQRARDGPVHRDGRGGRACARSRRRGERASDRCGGACASG